MNGGGHNDNDKDNDNVDNNKDDDEKTDDIQNKLNSALKDRSDPPYNTKISPVIQENVKKLEHQKKTDDINQRIQSRPDIDEMLDNDVLTSDPRIVSSTIASTQNELKQGLEDRASKEYLEQTKILKHSNIDASLQPMADDLEKSLTNKSPSAATTASTKPTETTVEIAPKLAAVTKQLDKKIKTDKLNKSLTDENRPNMEDLEKQDIVKYNNLSNNLIQTAVKLEKVQKSDSLSKQLKDENRMTQKELKEKGVLKYDNLSGTLANTANILEHQQKEDKLKKSLQNKPTVQDLEQNNILTANPSEVASSLHSAKDSLQKQQQKDKLNKNLKNRENIENLHEKNIITPNVAPAFAATQRELASAQKTDTLKQKLNNETRPNKEELEKQDILYSQSMAPSLQSNAKDLEERIREIQNNKENQQDEPTSSPSNDQSPTQTDIEQENENFEQITDINKESMRNALNQRSEKKMQKRLSKPIGANMVRTSLQQKLDRRLKKVDIERSGVVPHNYFDDPVSFITAPPPPPPSLFFIPKFLFLLFIIHRMELFKLRKKHVN